LSELFDLLILFLIMHVVDCAYAYGQFWELLFDFATPVHLDLHAHHVLFIIQALDI